MCFYIRVEQAEFPIRIVNVQCVECVECVAA
jgi:hypothetical protein